MSEMKFGGFAQTNPGLSSEQIRSMMRHEGKQGTEKLIQRMQKAVSSVSDVLNADPVKTREEISNIPNTLH